MKFFSGIEFICHGDLPDYRLFAHNREFDGYYGIQYNHAGRCQVQFGDGEIYSLHEGSGFFTAPGRCYSYGAPKGESHHHSFICFRGPRVDDFISGGLFSPYAEPPIFTIANPEQFYHHLLELHHLLLSPPAFHPERKIHLLEGLLLSISEEPSNTTPVNPFFRNAIETLRKKIMDKPNKAWDFAEESKKISLSYSHFRRIFQLTTGFSPHRFLIECRLNCAAKMLLESDLPINEIAHNCGYQDEYYFYRLFKQYRFCTALNYRKKFGR